MRWFTAVAVHCFLVEFHVVLYTRCTLTWGLELMHRPFCCHCFPCSTVTASDDVTLAFGASPYYSPCMRWLLLLLCIVSLWHPRSFVHKAHPHLGTRAHASSFSAAIVSLQYCHLRVMTSLWHFLTARASNSFACFSYCCRRASFSCGTHVVCAQDAPSPGD